MRYLLPWQWITVEGASMTPALLPGDRVLVRHAARVRAGDVVLARFPSRAELLVIKRAGRPSGGTGPAVRGAGTAPERWQVLSDNQAAGTDSRQLGDAEVLAVALLLRPGPMRRRMAASGAVGRSRSAGRSSVGGVAGAVRVVRLRLGAGIPRRVPRRPPVEL
jgi:hypothetical protein